MEHALTGASHDSQASVAQTRHCRTGFRCRAPHSVTASAKSAVYVTDVNNSMPRRQSREYGRHRRSGSRDLPACRPRIRRAKTELISGVSSCRRHVALRVAGDRGAVVIDAAALLQRSFSQPFGRTGAIRTGRGSNAVEWLNVGRKSSRRCRG